MLRVRYSGPGNTRSNAANLSYHWLSFILLEKVCLAFYTAILALLFSHALWVAILTGKFFSSVVMSEGLLAAIFCLPNFVSYHSLKAFEFIKVFVTL